MTAVSRAPSTTTNRSSRGDHRRPQPTKRPRSSRFRASGKGLLYAQAVLLVVAMTLPRSASAWTYPEHRDISQAAIVALPPDERAALDQLWTEARVNYASSACTTMAAGEQGLDPPCLDFAAWPALAGDHSCSSRDLAVDVVPGPWVLAVAKVAAETKAELASANSREQKVTRIAASLHVFAAYGLLQWNPAFLIRTYGVGTAEVGLSLGLMVGITSGLGTLLGGVSTVGTPAE